MIYTISPNKNFNLTVNNRSPRLNSLLVSRRDPDIVTPKEICIIKKSSSLRPATRREGMTVKRE